MKEKNISDDEIQILGQEWKNTKKVSSSQKKRKWVWWLMILALIVIVIFVLKHFFETKEIIDDYSQHSTEQSVLLETQPENVAKPGFIEILEKTINDVPLIIYIPHNAVPELTLDLPDKVDSAVIFVTRAADVGENNYNIVGDFVLAGEKLAKGVRKEGFCAIINQEITIGVATETPLLQKAINEKGYFFRQYPLVKGGMPIDNKPKGKAIRKALAIREGQVSMIASRDRESFHDFAQALADSGVSEAIYLVGSNTYGWAVDEQGKQITFGVNGENKWDGVNYLVWRKK